MCLLTLDEGPSLEMSSFCLFFSGSNITTQHSKSVTLHIIGTTHTGTDSFSMFRTPEQSADGETKSIC